MRTKTPNQIFEQWRRLTKLYKRDDTERLKRAAEITKRYRDNIYHYFGVAPFGSNTTAINDIFYYGAVPRDIYANK